MITAVMLVCALSVTAAAVHREFGSSSTRPAGASQAIGTVRLESGWSEAVRIGRVIGDKNAPTKIIILSDFECPACARFHEVAKRIRRASPNDVAVVLVDFPLPMHRFALPAARAAACATLMGKFETFVDRVFERQDSLGLKSWGSLAAEAGIADTARIAACAMGNESFPAIEAGLAFGQKIGVNSTPTVMVNGWRFSRSPTEDELIAAVEALKRGETPANVEVSGASAPAPPRR